MAKLECQLQGDFNKILDALKKKIMGCSMSATKEGSSDYVLNDIRCAVRVYERYSMLGGNRVSLNITLVGNNESSFLSAITAGGSQAVLFKINTLGEQAFLDCITKVVKQYSKY